MTQKDQQRIDDLEIKASFQEQLISDLNDELIRHGTRLAGLEQQLQRLVDLIQSLQSDNTDLSDDNEPPPHY